MIAVDHLLSDGRGSQPVTVTVCRTCEAADPDFNRLRSAGGLPFEALAGARLALTAGAGDERALRSVPPWNTGSVPPSARPLGRWNTARPFRRLPSGRLADLAVFHRHVPQWNTARRVFHRPGRGRNLTG